MKKISIAFIFIVMLGLFWLPKVDAISYVDENKKCDEKVDYIKNNDIILILGQGDWQTNNIYLEGNGEGTEKAAASHSQTIEKNFSKDKDIEIYIATEQISGAGDISTKITKSANRRSITLERKTGSTSGILTDNNNMYYSYSIIGTEKLRGREKLFIYYLFGK